MTAATCRRVTGSRPGAASATTATAAARRSSSAPRAASTAPSVDDGSPNATDMAETEAPEVTLIWTISIAYDSAHSIGPGCGWRRVRSRRGPVPEDAAIAGSGVAGRAGDRRSRASVRPVPPSPRRSCPRPQTTTDTLLRRCNHGCRRRWPARCRRGRDVTTPAPLGAGDSPHRAQAADGQVRRPSGTSSTASTADRGGPADRCAERRRMREHHRTDRRRGKWAMTRPATGPRRTMFASNADEVDRYPAGATSPTMGTSCRPHAVASTVGACGCTARTRPPSSRCRRPRRTSASSSSARGVGPWPSRRPSTTAGARTGSPSLAEPDELDVVLTWTLIDLDGATFVTLDARRDGARSRPADGLEAILDPRSPPSMPRLDAERRSSQPAQRGGVDGVRVSRSRRRGRPRRSRRRATRRGSPATS